MLRCFRRLGVLAALMLLQFASAYAQQWRSLGRVEFTDGWISPFFSGGSPAVLYVEACVNDDRTLVMLVEPYSSESLSLVTGENCEAWGKDRNIVFDVSDSSWVTTVRCESEAVTFPPGIFGDGEVALWVNSRGWYMNALGYDRPTLTAAGLNATYSEGKIIIPQSMVSFGPQSDALTQSFGDVPAASVIDLTTSGIHEVNNNDDAYGNSAEAEPIYFTLDGRQVDNIRIPGIYLQCRGSLVYKTVVR